MVCIITYRLDSDFLYVAINLTFQMDLNDDCWILILNLLQLKDQISAARACRRFHDILSIIWRKKYLNFSVYKHLTGTTENFAFFIKRIYDTVESMSLGSLDTDKWEIIKLYTYPNLMYLTLCHSNIASDEHVLKMTEIFPNLRHFSPNTPDITGKNIEKWRHLETLCFHDCECAEFSNFEKILEEVQLKSVYLGVFDFDCIWTSSLAFKKFCNLEEIAVNSGELQWLSDLSLFSNLKVLELLDLEEEEIVVKAVKDIAKHKSDDLVELGLCMHFPIHDLLVKPFHNLDKITLRWRGKTDFIPILKGAPNLREIVIREFKQLKENDIDQLLNSSEIEFISVQKCKCEFRDLNLNVKNIVKHRKKLLHFNFYENEFACYEHVTLTVEGESPLLKISQSKNEDWYCSDILRFR